MYDWGLQSGGFMSNALGSNNLQQWGGAIQQPFTGMPNQSIWQPLPNQATYGSGGQAQPRRPQIQMPQPQPTQASVVGQLARPVEQAAPQPQPKPQINTAQQVVPPRGPFVAGQIMNTGNVDMLQKNRLAQPSGGFQSNSSGSGGW